MKFIISFILLCVLLNIYLSNHNGVVDAASSISRDRSDYIRKQLELRSKAVNDQITKFGNEINQVFEDKYGGLFFGLTTTLNTLSGLFGMLNLAIPCGGAAIISSAVLGMAQNMVAGSSQQDIGSTIANGVKFLIDKSISQYNSETLSGVLKTENTAITEFYTDGVNKSVKADIYLEADAVHKIFYLRIAPFQLETYKLETIGLFVLHANAHLLFLHDMVTSGPELYGFNNDQKTYFARNFNQYLTEYRTYIDQVNQAGITYLNKKISDDGNRNQDEWNLRNDYYNYMKLYVYDISNYWDYLSQDFPNGMFIENAHVSLAGLFGAPYNGDNHMNYNQINTFIESKNPYQYQGKFKGVYYKNFKCSSLFNLVKYFGGRQNFFRDGVDRDTFYLGDEGSKAGPRQYVDLSGKTVKEVLQYLFRDGDINRGIRDYYWGLNIDGTNIGATYNGSKYINTLEFPSKSVASVLPISYNLCNVGCFCFIPCIGDTTVYLVESSAIGFVDSDITDDNIVFELTGSMIDAQKYNYLSSTSGVSYSRDGYKQYKHSMYFPADVKVTYKVNYNPYNRLPGNFKLYVDFKSTSGSINIQVYQSSSSVECIKQVINRNINIGSSGQLSYLSNIQLNPSNDADNYITIQFSRGVYMNSLVFSALE